MIAFYLCYLNFSSFNKTFNIKSCVTENFSKDKEKDKTDATGVDCESIPK